MGAWLGDLTWAALLMAVAAPALQAQEVRQDGTWRFQATPYVWMSGLDGQVRPFRSAPTADVDKSFSELLKNLDAAAFVTATARRDRFVLQGDLTHASTSDAAALPMGLSARAKVRQTSATLTAGYAFAPTEASGVDLMAGVRHWDVSTAVAVNGIGSARSTFSFVDPIIAARWRQQVAPRWSTLVYADAGGFGVGSQATWQVLGLANYQARDNLFLSMGYRHLSVDYRERGRRLDVDLSGPMLGLTFLFGKGHGAAALP